MNKTVLVTGGAGGIGQEICCSMADNGFSVAIGYNQNMQNAINIQNHLQSKGYSAVAVKIDVTSSESVKQAVQEITDKLGFISVVVNNAGTSQQKLFCDISETEWLNMIDVNLNGAYRVSKEVLPQMISKKQGNIINISSIWGQTGGSCEVHYSAAKAGLIGMTKALAKEVAPCNITVNAVAPGAVDTNMLSGFSQQDIQQIAQETPLERIATAKDVANTVQFLASENASFITGQILAVNGGLYI